jgi:hypothetical protein
VTADVGTSQKGVSIHLIVGNNVVKVLPNNTDITWNRIRALIQAEFKKPMRIRYRDNEGKIDLLDSFALLMQPSSGDLITPIADEDMLDALAFSDEKGVIKLYLSE